MNIQVYIWCHFPLIWRAALSILCSTDLKGTHFISFLNLKMSHFIFDWTSPIRVTNLVCQGLRHFLECGTLDAKTWEVWVSNMTYFPCFNLFCPHNNSTNGCYYYFHFITEESKAQNGLLTWLRHVVRDSQSYSLNPEPMRWTRQHTYVTCLAQGLTLWTWPWMSANVLVTGKGTGELHWLKNKQTNKKTVVHPLIGAHGLFLWRKSLLHFTHFLASTFPSGKSSYLI